MSDLPDYIFGIGPGRCGTKSLASLLSACDGIEAQHEGVHIAWADVTPAPLSELSGWPRAAVGYQWLWSARAALQAGEDVKVVGLVRAREDFIQSAMDALDHNLVTTCRSRESARFPTYDTNARTAWSKYWQRYMAEMCDMMGTWPESVTLLPTTALNDPQRVLDVCGVPRDRQTSQTFHLNRRSS